MEILSLKSFASKKGRFMTTKSKNDLGREKGMVALLMVIFSLGLLISPLMGTGKGLPPKSKGRVFLDSNRNNLPDPGEKGVSGILVTNGEDFTRTDAEGNFQLPSSRAINIWLSPPPGYQPMGSFFLPIEPSVAEYNFGLSPSKAGKRESVRVAFTSDLHLTDNPSFSPKLEMVIEAIRSSQPKVVFILGDLNNEANRAEPLLAEKIFKQVNHFREKLLVPTYCALGNHDPFGWSPEEYDPLDHPLFGKLMFEKLIGPRFYSLNIAGFHLVVLDVIGGKRLPHGWEYFGWLDEKQQKWLQEDLSPLPPETPLIILTHIPLLSSAPSIHRAFLPQIHASKLEHQGYQVGGSYVANLDQWFPRLKRFKDITFISGHFHLLEEGTLKGREKILRFYSCGALCGKLWQGDNDLFTPYLNISFPPGFLLLTLQEGKVVEALHKVINLP